MRQITKSGQVDGAIGPTTQGSWKRDNRSTANYRENSLRKKREEERGLNGPRSNQQTAGAALEISIACHEEYKEKNIPHDEDERGVIQASRSSGKTRHPTT
jgi:hypothetical protein